MSKVELAPLEDLKLRKDSAREEVRELARGMVVIGIPDELAWSIELEWKDCDDLADYPVDLLERYIELFPGTGLSDVIGGYLQLYRTKASDADEEEETPKGAVAADDTDDALSQIVVRLSPTRCPFFSPRSPITVRCTGWI